jgi:hypothetical protein
MDDFARVAESALIGPFDSLDEARRIAGECSGASNRWAVVTCGDGYRVAPDRPSYLKALAPAGWRKVRP